MAHEAAELFTVEWVDEESVTLVGQAGDRVDVPREVLPWDLDEGAVLRIELTDDGSLDWSTARVDVDEADRLLSDTDRQITRFREETGEDLEF